MSRYGEADYGPVPSFPGRVSRSAPSLFGRPNLGTALFREDETLSIPRQPSRAEIASKGVYLHPVGPGEPQTNPHLLDEEGRGHEGRCSIPLLRMRGGDSGEPETRTAGAIADAAGNPGAFDEINRMKCRIAFE